MNNITKRRSMILRWGGVSIVLSLILESITLLFTNNLMYAKPDNCRNVNFVTEITDIGKNIYVYMEHPQKVYTSWLEFDIGTNIYMFTCHYANESGEVKTIILDDVGRSRTALVPLNSDDCKAVSFYIEGNANIKRIQISEEPAKVVKKRIVNTLRLLVWWLLCFFCGLYLPMFLRWLKTRNWKLVCRQAILLLVIEAFVFLCCIIFWKLSSCKILGYHVFWSQSLGFVIFLVFIYLKKIIKIEMLWFFVSLCICITYTFTMPPHIFGGDEYTHMTRTVRLSQVYKSSLFNQYYYMLDNNNNIKYTDVQNAKKIADNEGIYNNTTMKISANTTLRTKTNPWREIAYYPEAMGLTIADALNLSPDFGINVGKLFHLLFGMILLYFALKKLKSGKMIFMLFTFFPFLLRQRCTYTYSMWPFIWFCYAFAYLIGELQQPDKPVQTKDVVKILLAFLIGALPKAPYFLVVFFILLLPRKKFKDKKTYKNFLICTSLTSIFIFSLLIFPIFFSNGMDIYSDKRGGGCVDAYKQLIFIFTHIFRYAKILLKNMVKIFEPVSVLFRQNGLTCLRTRTRVPFALAYAIIFFCTMLYDRNDVDYKTMTVSKRIYIWLLTFVNMALICTVLYMNYTDVGASEIKGVNPQYCIVFMFPLIYSFFSKKLNCISKFVSSYRMQIDLLVLTLWALLLEYAIYVDIVEKYVLLFT